MVILDAVPNTEMEKKLKTQRDNLRAERAILISLLTKAFPSLRAYHTPDESGDDFGNGYSGWVVYLKIPTGQISFHVGDDTSGGWFDHVMIGGMSPWDGHCSDEKWTRISEFIESREGDGE